MKLGRIVDLGILLYTGCSLFAGEQTYAQKATELRDEETHLSLEIERLTRERYEIADIAVNAFELSQQLRSKWFTADYAAKRRILEIICLNFSLEGVTLVPTMRKPFDVLAKGLDLKKKSGRLDSN